MFKIRHEPGELGLSDFIQLKGVAITVQGKPFQHLYHYRLAYSGWQYVQVNIPGWRKFFRLVLGLTKCVERLWRSAPNSSN